MARTDDEVKFGFDPKPFTNGLDTINQHLGNLGKKMQGTAKGMEKAMFWAMAKVNMLGAALKGLGNMLKNEISKNIPEIGQAFGIAKDIFFKNFMWPLRKFLAPLLQKMLNWVRDHRTMFVRWGAVVANIFRMVIELGKQFCKILKMAWDILAPALKSIFGDTAQSFNDIVNLLTAKIAVLAQFLMILLEPIVRYFAELIEKYFPRFVEFLAGIGKGFAEGFGDGLKFIIDIVTWLEKMVDNWTKANTQGKSLQTVVQGIAEFFGKIVAFLADIVGNWLQGFVESTKDIMTPLQTIVDAFNKIFNALFGGTRAKMWEGLFQFFGLLVGTAIKGALDAIGWAFDALAKAIEWIVSSAEATINFFKMIGNVLTGKKWDEGLGSGGAPSWTTGGGTPAPRSGGDMIIKPNGQMFETDPKDTIVAHKGTVSYMPGETTRRPDRGGGGAAQNITITLNVTEGSARAAGVNFAEGLQRGFRNGVLDSLVAGGL